ncbi:type IX secretion system protein PorG [Psychroserpens sp.]
MRYLILFLLSMFFTQTSHSQIYEVGMFAGGSNFIGDIGATDYIAPNTPAFGLLLKWNRSPRHSWRVSIIYAELSAKDIDSDDPRRISRNYEFDTNIIEMSAGMEFTFWDFDLHTSGLKIVPYLYSGITVAKHDNFFYGQNGEIINEDTVSWAYGIPMTLGIKSNITNHFILGFEIGARYTFSDELDGSVPDGDFKDQVGIGNTNSNDWYVFTGFTLTYTFGQRPCYCNF